MTHEIMAKDFNGHEHIVNIDKLDPDFCPICQKHVSPSLLGSYLNGEGTKSRMLQRVYKCTNSKCGAIFLAIYEGVPQGGGFNSRCWYFYRRVAPGNPKKPIIPENIAKVSKDFEKIYTQASYAEFYGLNEVCGVGYRKALEYLVKDFLITKAKELSISEEKIKSSTLHNCIINYIDDPMTKSVAKRATWLGNDETHYLRKWEDKDIEDLKTLLKLTINSIENQLLAQAYESDMQE